MSADDIITDTVPTDGSFGYSDGKFFSIGVPTSSLLPITLAEIPLHDGASSIRTLRVERARFIKAIACGHVTILAEPKPVPAARATVPSRPYPFEADHNSAEKRRTNFWRRREIVALCRRGLLMTGAQYIRHLADRVAPTPSESTDDGID